ncbi:MAG: XkdF-like putative serine protease domain-containing protein [Geminicoccaceae bacterium]
MDKRLFTKFAKVDAELGLVLGFAIVCKVDGEPYFDLQDDHIPEDSMLKAATDFMENSREAKEMHEGGRIGDIVFAFPLTEDIAKAFDIQTKTTGLMIAMKPCDDETLEKFRSGEFTGFSIGGLRVEDEDAEA